MMVQIVQTENFFWEASRTCSRITSSPGTKNQIFS